MKKFTLWVLLGVCIPFFYGCGKKGPIHPPVTQVPQKIQSIQVFQRGKSLILEWENPQSYTDGSPLPGIREVEIWLCSKKKSENKDFQPLSPQKFKKEAERIITISRKNFSEYRLNPKEASSDFCYVYPMKEEEFLSRIYIFGMRIRDRENKKSPFSEFKSVEPQLVSLPPRGLQGHLSEERIELEWEPPQKNIDLSSPPELKGYNIYRAKKEEDFTRINSQLIQEEKYKDTDISFGPVYSYLVRASATKSSPYVESDNSEIIEIHAQDKFPPEAPNKVKAIVGKDTVALSWQSNQEKDLEGYRVWRRKEETEDYELLTSQTIQENAYIDSTVEMNQRYYYAITALDEAGNESPRSQSVYVKVEEDLDENLSL
ncbi:hypothetical protein KGY73_03110 [bacterium]|nr:hypothetical protein [bacterium]